MGNNESVMRLVGALGQPCTQCCHDLSRVWEDECVCDSGCGENENCCHVHMETHHRDNESDEESGEENAGPTK